MLVYHDIAKNQFYEVEDGFFIVDGANIAFEARSSKNKPKLSNILALIEKFERNKIENYKVICDRSLFYCIDNKKEYSQLIKNSRIIESPENIPADVFVLQVAFNKNAYMISNDQFKEFHSIYTKEWISKNRISFRIIDGIIYFDKLIVKEVETWEKKAK